MSQADLAFQLTFQSRMLEKQAKKQNTIATKERNTAKRHLEKGERGLAQLHAQNSSRASQMSDFYAGQSSKLNGMSCDLKMAEVQKSTAKSLGQAVKSMEKIMTAMDPAKIAAMSMKYDEIRGKVGTVQQIMTPTDETVEIGGESLLADLMNEIDTEALMDNMAIPGSPVEATEQANQPAYGQAA